MRTQRRIPLNHHPTAAELEGLVFGGISAERSRAVIAHLLRGCGTCGLTLAPYLQSMFGQGKRPELPPPAPEVYDGALDRAFAAVKRLGVELPQVKTPDQKKWDALALLASGGLEGLLEAPGLPGLPLYEALLERSWTLRFENPDQMLELARCAALLADQWSESEYGAREVADLRCRAWTELGNAYRVADELDLADQALDRARDHFVLGTRDELLEARLFDVLASQFAARRFFDLACDILDIVAEIYRRRGDEHLAGRALIMKGIFTGYEGDAEEAVRTIRSGLSTVDDQRDPGLVFTALQSQAWFLVDCGRFRDARFVLWDLRQRNLDIGGRLGELKVRWLEGHIFVGLEQLDRAEQALGQVKEGFEEAGLRFKAALAGLELGAVWLRQGRFDEAIAVVLECTDVFFSLGIHREAAASVFMLQKAGKMRNLTLTLLDHVIKSLHKLER
jgi:tetratricopeptide (TPR) repeat protein